MPRSRKYQRNSRTGSVEFAINVARQIFPRQGSLHVLTINFLLHGTQMSLAYPGASVDQSPCSKISVEPCQNPAHILLHDRWEFWALPCQPPISCDLKRRTHNLATMLAFLSHARRLARKSASWRYCQPTSTSRVGQEMHLFSIERYQARVCVPYSFGGYRAAKISLFHTWARPPVRTRP
jgi:hypothetical protein